MQSMIILLIAKIDEKINHQLNVIIHHAKFQQLEAVWRGIKYLVDVKAEFTTEHLKVKCLSLSVNELIKDTLTAVEFDQSQLFKKIYNDEFDMPGGEPYGLMIGDYAFSHVSVNGKVTNSISVLTELSRIAAAAFSPFIFSIDPALFGLDSFAELEKQIDFYHLFSEPEYLRWNNFRKQEDSRFIGFVLPKILMRNPINKYTSAMEIPYFNEKIANHHDYLWGNANFCFAEVVMRSFAETGWFLNIRGMMEEETSKGFTTGVVKSYFDAAKNKAINKYMTEINILDKKEDILNHLGFIVLVSRNLSVGGVFYSTPSIQRADQHQVKYNPDSAYLSTLLNHILCAARFAHYIKIIIRNKIGSYATAEECKHYLEQWILQYCALTSSNRIAYPLRDAKINIESLSSVLGKYLCRIDITPHYQLDRIESSIKFRSQVAI